MIPFDKIPSAKIALLDHDQAISYGELQKISKKYQQRIQKLSEPVVFLPMKPQLETIYKLIGCILAKKIFVPLSSENTLEYARKLSREFSTSILWGREFVYFQSDRPPLIFPEDTLFIGFTSGTTGERKGFIRNQISWLESFKIFHSIPVFQPKKYVTCLTPLHYSLGLYVLLQTLCSGQTFLVGVKKLTDPLLTSTILNNLQLFSVPTVFQHGLEEVEQEKHGNFDIILGGETVTLTQRKKIVAKCPQARLFDFYGASETSFISYNYQPFPDEHCVGKTFPKVKVTLQDEGDGVGEIVVESPINFQGYLKKGKIYPPQNAIATGDLGSYTGELYYYGRKDERINRKGEKIFPLQIEKLLRKLPQIQDTVVYGRPDEKLGERVIAEIVWQDQPLSLAEVNQFIAKTAYSKGKIDTILTVNLLAYGDSGKKLNKL
ncbi:AMP-binding protein [Enterococcus sp. DIV1420a]|uniref:AMP-binding protein n=1 Tax=Enterococcus TaxID=1350 RepID=UPI0036D6D8CD